MSFFCLSPSAHATTPANGSASSTADIVVNLTSAISIRTLDNTASSEIESLNLELTPTPSGRFTKDTTIVDVATSNATGYMLYMASDYTNPHTSTSGNPVYTTDMIHSDASVASNYSIPTIDPTLGGTSSATTISETEFSMVNSSYKNRWGYSLTEKNVAGTYKSIPAHNSPDTINDTVSTAVEHSYTPVTVGVNVDTNIASGTYTNELEFTAIANALPITYSLEFDTNGSDSGNPGTTTPTDITDATISSLPSPNPMTNSTTASSYTFTIPSTTPETSVAGFAFKEWNTSPDGTGTSYQPGDTFQIVADTSLIDPGARTIYAIWEEKGGFFGITYMQEMTPEICADATTPDKTATTNADTDGSHAGDTSYVPETTLIDYRGIDGTGTASSPATGTNQVSYKVRKLADGNCWMTQNLRLTLSTSTALEVATFDGNTASWTPNSTTSANAYNYAITPNTKANLSVNTDIDAKNGGNAWYYPWYAATAGQGTQTTNPTITQSICPKGWRLPPNSSDKSFYNLITTKYGLASSSAGSTSLQSFPLEFTLSGNVVSGSQHNAGSYGYYWSASPYTSNANYAYHLYFNSSSISPQSYNNKYNGRSVRCVSI